LEPSGVSDVLFMHDVSLCGCCFFYIIEENCAGQKCISNWLRLLRSVL